MLREKGSLPLFWSYKYLTHLNPEAFQRLQSIDWKHDSLGLNPLPDMSTLVFSSLLGSNFCVCGDAGSASGPTTDPVLTQLQQQFMPASNNMQQSGISPTDFTAPTNGLTSKSHTLSERHWYHQASRTDSNISLARTLHCTFMRYHVTWVDDVMTSAHLVYLTDVVTGSLGRAASTKQPCFPP